MSNKMPSGKGEAVSAALCRLPAAAIIAILRPLIFFKKFPFRT